MSKIKFNKEWYVNNKIAIHCRTEVESKSLTKELHKLDIDKNWDMSVAYKYYREDVCYECDENLFMSYGNVSYYITHNYLIINFSDLEFESDIIKNESKITKTENEELGYDLSVEVDKSDKNHILRDEVKLNSGDVICVKNSSLYSFGIITSIGILYANGLCNSLDNIQSNIINKELVWYIPSKDIKDKLLLVSQFLFKGKLDDKLKDLIIYVEDEPNKVGVEIFEVKFKKTNIFPICFINGDNKCIFKGDVVSPTSGVYKGYYGEVIRTKIEKLTQEELNSYSKITKIK